MDHIANNLFSSMVIIHQHEPVLALTGHMKHFLELAQLVWTCDFDSRLKTLQVTVYAALAIPPGDDSTVFCSRPMFARAVGSFHGRPWFSNVAIQGVRANGNFEEWYGQVRTFLGCCIERGAAASERKEFAVVRFYKVAKKTDPATSCTVLQWEKPRPTYRLVDVQQILRAVHVIPKFDTSDSYLLNRFLFEYT